MPNVDMIRVGDHVIDGDANDPSVGIVISRPGLSADEYVIDATNRTVADVNTGYPESDGVVNVVYPDGSDRDIDSLKPYAYPVSRLVVVTAIKPPEVA